MRGTTSILLHISGELSVESVRLQPVAWGCDLQLSFRSFEANMPMFSKLNTAVRVSALHHRLHCSLELLGSCTQHCCRILTNLSPGLESCYYKTPFQSSRDGEVIVHDIPLPSNLHSDSPSLVSVPRTDSLQISRIINFTPCC